MYYSLHSASRLTPEPPAHARQLIVLLHDAGAGPEDMLPLASTFHQQWPEAAIALPAGLEACHGPLPGHRQWYEQNGINDSNRRARVQAVMPAFIELIRGLQETTGVSSRDTVLVGFSQGAIMALEAVQKRDGLAGRVLAFAGRYSDLPHKAPRLTRISLFHGDHDKVMPLHHAQAAFAQLQTLGGDVSLDIAHAVGHELSFELVNQAIVRLKDSAAAPA